MTTYGDNTANRFYPYVRPGYRYTYALIDAETGEVRTMSCDAQFVPLKALYGYFDGIRCECERKGARCRLTLANCRTGEVIAEVNTDYGIVAAIGVH